MVVLSNIIYFEAVDKTIKLAIQIKAVKKYFDVVLYTVYYILYTVCCGVYTTERGYHNE